MNNQPLIYSCGLDVRSGDHILYFTQSHWMSLQIFHVFDTELRLKSDFDRCPRYHPRIIAGNVSEHKLVYIFDYDNLKYHLVFACRGIVAPDINRYIVRWTPQLYESDCAKAYDNFFNNTDPIISIFDEDAVNSLGGKYFEYFEKRDYSVYASGIRIKEGDVVILPDFQYTFAIFNSIGYEDGFKSMIFFSNAVNFSYEVGDNEHLQMNFDDPVFYARSGGTKLSADEYDEIIQFEKYLICN